MVESDDRLYELPAADRGRDGLSSTASAASSSSVSVRSMQSPGMLSSFPSENVTFLSNKAFLPGIFFYGNSISFVKMRHSYNIIPQ